MSTSAIQDAIALGLSPGGNLNRELKKVRDVRVESVDDARAICEGLVWLGSHGRADRGFDASLRTLATFFQQVTSREALEWLEEHGIPLLVSIFDSVIGEPDFVDRRSDLVMFILKIFAIYRTKSGVERIARAIRLPRLADEYLWAVIFEGVHQRNPFATDLVDALRDPLPSGFAAVTYLDFANSQAIVGKVSSHPFDTPAGKARLLTWISGADADEFSCARSAAMSLPFVSNPERDQLLAIAMDHADPSVQLEAARASARLGSGGGLKLLARFSLDPAKSAAARKYLEELGRADLIPSEADNPDFLATAEMAEWLAHPTEFGRPPDAIELYDTRELYWPPTDDVRTLRLFKYIYKSQSGDGPDDVGIGMVGSVTFALFGETTAELAPEDAYALHCCWELECNGDPRAPRKRSAAAGRAILEKHNP